MKVAFIWREQHGQRGREKTASGPSVMDGLETFLVKQKQPTSLSLVKLKKKLKMKPQRDKYFPPSGASCRLNNSRRALQMAGPANGRDLNFPPFWAP